MSAQKAILDHAQTVFREFVEAALAHKGWAQSDLAKALHGVDELGRAKQTGAISQQLSGITRMHETTLERWAAALDVPYSELQDAYRLLKDIPREDRKRHHKSKRSGKPVWQPADVPRLARPSYAEPAEPEPEPEPPQFSLIVDPRGLASISINMVDVPLEKALRAMSALTGAGLLNTGCERTTAPDD